MKHILLLFALLFAMASCTSEERPAARSGMVQVEIAAGALTRADDEAMQTVRLIVFTDLDTATPRAEVNRLYVGANGDFTVSGTPPKARFTLEVSRRKTQKLVVAVINEPSANTSELAAIARPADLDAIRLKWSSFVAFNHLSLLPGAAIPMTGALRTDRLFRTETEAGRADNILRLEVERAVARVDVYLKRGTDFDPDLKIYSAVVLFGKTCTEGNLFYHPSLHIGSLPTVISDLTSRSWEYEGLFAIDETRPVCSFFTPERTHTANRLRVIIGLNTEDGAPRTGEFTLTSARDKITGATHPVDEIRRNHIYAITATVGVNDITAEVLDWEDVPLTTEF